MTEPLRCLRTLGHLFRSQTHFPSQWSAPICLAMLFFPPSTFGMLLVVQEGELTFQKQVFDMPGPDANR